MDIKNKIITQSAICIMIFAVVKGAGVTNSDAVKNFKKAVEDAACVNYTLQELKTAGAEVFEKIKEAPPAISRAVIQANELGEFGEPIDEEPKERIQPVHAVSGGVVKAAGISENLGMYIQVLHQEKTSLYGNLSDINAIPGERVKKGDIIGSFDTEGEKEFIYELEENVV